DIVEQSLRKGNQVFVEGHLRMDNWTSQDGQKRSKLVVVVENFQFLEPRPEGSGMGGGAADGGTRVARQAPAQAPRQASPPAAAAASAGQFEEEAEAMDSMEDEGPGEDKIPF